jgi:hypothetical protein
MIVVAGLIMFVSAIGNSHISATRLSNSFIASHCFYGNMHLKSFVFDNISILERIETRVFFFLQDEWEISCYSCIG